LGSEPQDAPVPPLIFDTGIAVWMLRKYPPAINFAEKVEREQRCTSAVSHLELLYGCRNSTELWHLQEVVANWFTEVVPLTPDATESARELMEQFALSRRPGVGGVLIAATALNRHETLVTCNRKHFEFIRGLEVKIFRPCTVERNVVHG
jgi:predicted nucleic acid-binding protein